MSRYIPLRVRVFATTAISGLIPLIIAVTILHYNFINSFEEQIRSQAMDIAMLAVDRRDVKMAYSTANPSDELQQIANDIQLRTKAVFVVFMDMEGKRYSHPNESLIGQYFTGGDEGPVLQKGESYTSKAVGISGPSIRAFVPVFDLNNQQVGAVSVGFWEPDISLILSKIYKIFYLVLPLGLIIILVFSVLLARSIKNLIFGMEPIEIATLLKERDSMLHSIKEGIIAINNRCEITAINHAAQNLFPVGIQFIGRNIIELIPDSQLPSVMKTGQADQDQQLIINGNVVLTNRVPLSINGKVVGAIATFRPLTEVSRIAEELTGVKKLVDALRSRSHEFLNKLHVISGLIQLDCYDEARKYIANLTYKEQSLISFLINNIHNAAVAGLLIGKASEAEEKNIKLEIDRSSQLFKLPDYFNENAMVVVLGNLIENAFDAVSEAGGERLVRVLLKQNEIGLTIKVMDTGSGISEEVKSKIFYPGFTTKKKGQGVGLTNLKNRVDVAGGTITINTSAAGTTFQIAIPFSLELE
ncbi:ATP-binding protein [Desulfitibacter alkalitolerans]|uniref:ATP-binding protein n=1 Tax=Desulfitibacter alkalitolerans TaxID=264641 RepID=UPI0006860994|nr:sensor histidine kinase [Desulfitibacter alkalitolerans]